MIQENLAKRPESSDFFAMTPTRTAETINRNRSHGMLPIEEHLASFEVIEDSSLTISANPPSSGTAIYFMFYCFLLY